MSSQNLSRRILLAGVPTLAVAVTLPAAQIDAAPVDTPIIPPPQGGADPIYDAIDAHRKSLRSYARSAEKLESAEFAARDKFGDRPYSLVLWRGYHIGGSEIDARREDLLQAPGADPKKVEAEYEAAKAREIAGERAGGEWDKRAGVTKLRRENFRDLRAERRAAVRVAKTKPTTAAGVAALITYILNDIDDDVQLCGWARGLKNAAAACLELKS